jgi:hypothetical protein
MDKPGSGLLGQLGSVPKPMISTHSLLSGLRQHNHDAIAAGLAQTNFSELARCSVGFYS